MHDILSGRPQPGAIEIPVDLQYAKADFTIPAGVSGSVLEPQAEQLAAAANLISSAGPKRFILAGGGVIRADAGAELVGLAEALDCPVYTTTNGRGSIPEDHPLSMGTFLMPSAGLLAEADLMIAVGTRFQGGTTGNYQFTPPRKLIHIDADNHMISLNYKADVGVVSDAKPALTALHDALNAEKGDAGFRAATQEAADSARSEIRSRMGPDFEAIMDCIRESLPAGGNIVRDATISAYVWGNTLIPILEPRTSMHSTSAAIGPGLPLGLGAAMGSNEKTVIIQGDGGFMLNIGELATAAQYNTPVIVCVFNDQGYGVLRRIQASRFDGRNNGVDLTTPDFAAVANAMGVRGINVAGLDGFRKAFAEAMEHDGPVLLDIDLSTLAPMKLPF